MGDAWFPFFTAASMATTTRTAPMTSEADLAAGIAYMREHCEQVGRERPPEIILGSVSPLDADMNPEALLQTMGRFQELGVSGGAVHVSARTRSEWCEIAERFGVEVLARLPRA